MMPGRPKTKHACWAGAVGIAIVAVLWMAWERTARRAPRRSLAQETGPAPAEIESPARVMERGVAAAAGSTVAAGVAPSIVVPRAPGPTDFSAEDANSIVAKRGWEDAGNDSARAALETYLWAVRSGNTEKLATVLTVGVVPTDFQRFAAKLTPEARAEYDTPAKVAAVMVASQEERFAAIQSVQINAATRPGNVSLTVQLLDDNGVRLTKVFWLRQTGEGWQVFTFWRQVDDFFAGRPRRGFPLYFERGK